jgi:hypothetical protein
VEQSASPRAADNVVNGVVASAAVIGVDEYGIGGRIA